MYLLERYILSRHIERGKLQYHEFVDLCNAYTACEKGAEELLKKQFQIGIMTDKMRQYLNSDASSSVKKLYESCHNKKS